MKEQDNDFSESHLPMTSLFSGAGIEVEADVFQYTVGIVNLFFIGKPTEDQWVLIDTGMPHEGERIIQAAEDRFGKGAQPEAIILTHGHFDHVGSLEDLLGLWDVPVYAHAMELPYLTGERDYPKGDPTAGGLVSKLSPRFPNHGIDLKGKIQTLPSSNKIPQLKGWKWIHTPGHTEGHISLFRESDRLLIAGDAFVTVKQESIYSVFTQKQEISGPPKYFTSDWIAAKKSIETILQLEPQKAATGHGLPMSGTDLDDSLNRLVLDFDNIALPKKYLN
ncbi:MBL fold metallo-hydrolase [Pseudalkalibacillus hwajinpoensis]|uniref:MBL fold metallo-hydrolase n=1 Tax=Guptibacillus hwajinpoensis TaxID=208199 RepID=UPI00325C1085